MNKLITVIVTAGLLCVTSLAIAVTPSKQHGKSVIAKKGTRTSNTLAKHKVTRQRHLTKTPVYH
ncbi:hypothetical protein [Burkholderia pyrrocinia]